MATLPNISLDLIRAEKARRSLKEFIKLFWPVVEPTTPFVDGWVIDCFCYHLEAIDEIRNLLINVCPGVSKSSVFSVFFPCWKLVNAPGTKLLYSSYALNLSERDSVKCRRLIQSDLFQRMFGSVFQITKDVDTKRHFETDRGGFRQSISIGSQTKGLKGNYCVLDDPHNASDADSEIKREEAITWFVDSWYDRLCDFSKDCRVVIGPRIGRNDLSQFILDNYHETWTNLILPYEYRPTSWVSPIGWRDPRTEEGQPLWPERFPEKEIQQLKRRSRTFHTQWNQTPQDSENALFKADDFRYYAESETAYHLGERRIAKADCWRLMAVDLAISLDKRADYSVIMIADVARTGEIILVHTTRERIGGTRIVPTLQAMSEAYRPAYVLIEDVAFQRMVLDQARQQGLAVRGIRPDGDKESRTLPLQVRFEAGQVWFPQGKDWLPILETELIEFPNSRHDDTVDTLAYIAYEAGRRNRARPEPKEESPAETPEARMARGLFAGLR